MSRNGHDRPYGSNGSDVYAHFHMYARVRMAHQFEFDDCFFVERKKNNNNQQSQSQRKEMKREEIR